MEISDVRVRLVTESTERLKAVCSVTLDSEFVVRDVKIVEGTHGLFVAMPSRKLSSPCPRCKMQNQLRAKYCNECGTKLPPARIPADADGREKAHRDIAHPITATFRKTIQDRVLESYRLECEKDENAEVAEEAGHPGSAGEAGLEHEEGLAEYDALIADLNDSGSHEALRDDRATPRGHAEPSAGSDRDQPRHRRGRRRRRGRGEMRPAEAPRGERPSESKTGGESDGQSAGERGPGEPSESYAEEPHAAHPAEERRESFSAGRPAGSRTEKQRETEETPEDESPFGAGLV